MVGLSRFGVGCSWFVRQGLGLVRDAWTLVGWGRSMIVCPFGCGGGGLG